MMSSKSNDKARKKRVGGGSMGVTHKHAAIMKRNKARLKRRDRCPLCAGDVRVNSERKISWHRKAESKWCGASGAALVDLMEAFK